MKYARHRLDTIKNHWHILPRVHETDQKNSIFCFWPWYLQKRRQKVWIFNSLRQAWMSSMYCGDPIVKIIELVPSLCTPLQWSASFISTPANRLFSETQLEFADILKLWPWMWCCVSWWSLDMRSIQLHLDSSTHCGLSETLPNFEFHNAAGFRIVGGLQIHNHWNGFLHHPDL